MVRLLTALGGRGSVVAWTSLFLLSSDLGMNKANAATVTCRSLSDRDSLFYQSITNVLNVSEAEVNDFPIETIMEPLDKMMPEFSKCLGSISPLNVIMTAMMNPKTNECMEQYNATKVAWEASSSSSTSSSSSKARAEEMKQFCINYKEMMLPCANDVLIKTIISTFDGSDGCCDQFQAKIKASFGEDLPTMADNLMKLVGDVICSDRTYKDSEGRTITETCGEAIQDALSGKTGFETFLTVLQTPNNQGCAAVKGEEFETTMGNKTQLFADSAPLDVCYKPVSSFLEHIRKYPMMNNMTSADGSIKMLDLFEENKCIKGEGLMKWASSKNSSSPQGWLKMMDHYKILMKSLGGDTYNNTNLTSLWSSSRGSDKWDWDDSDDGENSSDKKSFMDYFFSKWHNKTDGEWKNDNFTKQNISDSLTAAFAKMETKLAGMCFHLPNSMEECKFEGSLQLMLNADPSSSKQADIASNTGVYVKMSFTLTLLMVLMTIV